jgi:hypothetical protein
VAASTSTWRTTRLNLRPGGQLKASAKRLEQFKVVKLTRA